MKNIFILSLVVLLLSSFLMFALLSQAATFSDINQNLQAAGTATGYETGSDYTVIVARIIKTALSIVGGLFVLLITYGGFLWMTAETGAGRNQLDKAKKVLTWAIIGLIIIAAAYAITSFVITTVEKASPTETEPLTLLIK